MDEDENWIIKLWDKIPFTIYSTIHTLNPYAQTLLSLGSHPTPPQPTLPSVSNRRCLLCWGLTCFTVTFPLCDNRDFTRTQVVAVQFLSASHHISVPFSTPSNSHHPGALCQHRLFIFRPSSRAHRCLSKQQHTSVPLRTKLKCTHAMHKSSKSGFLLLPSLCYGNFCKYPSLSSLFSLFNHLWDYHVWPPPL